MYMYIRTFARIYIYIYIHLHIHIQFFQVASLSTKNEAKKPVVHQPVVKSEGPKAIIINPVRNCECAYVYMRVCLHVYVSIWMCVCMCMYIHMDKRTRRGPKWSNRSALSGQTGGP